MYGRDKEVEKTEIFERLLAGLDKLIEVVSKDETSRGILDSLKERGAKELKEIPAADNRAEEIRTRRPAAPGLGGSSGSNFDFSTMSRLNTAFRALSGDLGAFQRNLGNAVVWSQKASQAYKAASTYTADSVLPKRQEYRKATDEEVAKAMQDAAAKGLNGNQMMQVAADLAKKGVPIEGKPSDDLAEKAHKATKTGTPVNVTPKAGSAIANASGGLDVAALARIAGTVALAAAPVVLGKIVQGSAMHQIEGNRQFQMLDPNLATSYAMYNQSRLLTNMKYAKGISASMDRLLNTEGEFQKTLEPIKTLGTNATNNFLSAGTDIANFMLKPISKLADSINNGSKRGKALAEEMEYTGGLGAWIGGGLGAAAGGIAGWFTGGPFGAIIGAARGGAYGAAAGGSVGAFAGGTAELITGKRREEMEKFSDLTKTHIMNFAKELESAPMCAPRRFCP